MFTLPAAVSPDVALFIARAVLAIVFIYYGMPKIKDLRANARDFESMGFKPGWLWGTPAALLETVGAVLILLGYWVQILAVLFAAYMAIGTLWKMLKTNKKFGDWSYDLTLLAIALLLAAYGGGIYVLT